MNESQITLTLFQFIQDLPVTLVFILYLMVMYYLWYSVKFLLSIDKETFRITPLFLLRMVLIFGVLITYIILIVELNKRYLKWMLE